MSLKARAAVKRAAYVLALGGSMDLTVAHHNIMSLPLDEDIQGIADPAAGPVWRSRAGRPFADQCQRPPITPVACATAWGFRLYESCAVVLSSKTTVADRLNDPHVTPLVANG